MIILGAFLRKKETFDIKGSVGSKQSAWTMYEYLAHPSKYYEEVVNVK